MDFKGKVILEKSMACTAAADSTTLLAEFPGCTFAVKDKYEEYFRIRFDTSGCEYENRYFFADICEINRLKLPPAGLRIRKASLRTEISACICIRKILPQRQAPSFG